MFLAFFHYFCAKIQHFSGTKVNSTKDPQTLYIEDYNYKLPDEYIAKYPLARRDDSKLLVYKNNEISETKFSKLVDFLPSNALLVFNNTKVIQARLRFTKSTGAQIEVFCLEPILPADYAQSLGSTTECLWKCMVGNLKKWKGENLYKEIEIKGFKCRFSAELIETFGNTHHVLFKWDNPEIHFAEILDFAGELPIPPYLHRKTEESDLTTYQTVYSKIKGSVAAPTAGLHFTAEVLAQLQNHNIETDELTLHVGAGTFQPVKTNDIADHKMHAELISVNVETIKHLLQKIGNIIAVGTTSVRSLESLYQIGVMLEENVDFEPNIIFKVDQWFPYQQHKNITCAQSFQNILDFLEKHKLNSLQAQTQIIIKPGYIFKVIEGMITNFHQPKSTLLLLVSAFVEGNWQEIYNYALRNNFRFLSYGDSSLLLK